ncbi:ferric-dicitrate binding protein FerR, regulates iron transport through sigma-19 [Mucilaginibacter gossypiicola]|uniref:Ferric-dicitrate binding protein FerR, regulates iron transport through sigma-19 n=1 Tax=Mucilaginibacter gossypiicola TaxID=551995 RepID=A0A1H8V0Y0_9SPHI|nr:FecR family protein [Mucilaginibacter gossypiicola]SEP09055.1 ferric-dicitrate binding protein FerR, regulates iron transport through sigma-19 [Mucilaginibacter gossypiicola]
MDQEIILLLRKYVNNNCNTQELESVRQLITSGQYEGEWDAVLQEEALTEDTGFSNVPDFRQGEVLNRINRSIKPVKQLTFPRWSLGAAAAILIMLSAGYLFFNNRSPVLSSQPLLSVTSSAGQQKKITLTDGTEVILNSLSTLQYKDFNGAKREVYLEGEAFFNVAHDARHPFVVHTQKLNVHVLGTSFNVSAYVHDRKTTVSVATGKVGVNVSNSSHANMLLPGDRLSYNGNIQTDHVSPDDVLGWQKGILVFHQESIRDIAPVLERYYGVHIYFGKNNNPGKQVTAAFKQKTLPQVMVILSQTAGFTYQLTNSEIHID